MSGDSSSQSMCGQDEREGIHESLSSCPGDGQRSAEGKRDPALGPLRGVSIARVQYGY